MSKRTLALIFGLLVITAFLIKLAIEPQGPIQQITKPTPTIVPNTKTATLSLVPQTLMLSSSSGSLDVVINSGKNTKVTAVQLSLSYDPKVIYNVKLAPGNFFDQPVELINTIDRTGTIRYAVGLQPSMHGKTGIGTVATISFQTYLTNNQSTFMTFLPKTIVTGQGLTTSVLKQTSGAKIQFVPR